MLSCGQTAFFMPTSFMDIPPIKRETALKWLAEGRAVYAGLLTTTAGQRHWVIKQIKYFPGQRFSVKIAPGEELTGCVACGQIGEPVAGLCQCGANLATE